MEHSLENRSAGVASFSPAWLGECASYITAYMVTEAFQRPSESQSGVGGFLLFSLKKKIGFSMELQIVCGPSSSFPLLIPQ